MPYTPNPYNLLQPTDNVFAGTAAAEFRAMKIALQALSTGSLYRGDWATFVALGPDPHPAVLGDQFTHAGALWLLKSDVADVELIPPNDLDTLNWFKLLQAAVGGFVPLTDATGSAALPTGTTAQRDTATSGYLRRNSDLGALEYSDGTSWIQEGWQVGAEVAMSGASGVLTGIPEWANEIAVFVRGASHNSGTAQPLRLQLGGAGGLVTAGYSGGVLLSNASGNGVAAWTDGARNASMTAATVIYGTVRFTRSGAVWMIALQISATDGIGHTGNGVCPLTTGATQVGWAWPTAGATDGGALQLAWRK